MIPPALAAQRFVPAVLLGLALGLLWGFLQPVRKKLPLLIDLIFLIPLVQAWLYLSFGICLGDLRPIYTLTLLLSAVLWDQSLGRWLSPVFTGFWGGIFRFLVWVSGFWKKIFCKCKDFGKKCFASGKKRGIIKWNNRLHLWRRTGGTSHGK